MRSRSSGGKLTQDHHQVARSPSGEAAAARRAWAGSLSDALSGPVVTNVIQIQRAPSRSFVPRLLFQMLFIQTEWDVRARRRYSFRATLNMDGTALLLRCNNGRYKNEGYEPNGCVHGTSEHWRHERMVSNCAPALLLLLLRTVRA